MGKRGPKPKPTAIRLLEGNPGRLPINPDEIQCDLPPVMPHIVGADSFAAEEWHRIIAAMPPNVYTALDVAVLTQYCLAWSMLMRAQHDLSTNGMMVVTNSWRDKQTGELVAEERIVNPAAKLWAKAQEQLNKCTDRLGLSPGVRARMPIPQSRTKPNASKFGGLLKAAPAV